MVGQAKGTIDLAIYHVAEMAGIMVFSSLFKLSAPPLCIVFGILKFREDSKHDESNRANGEDCVNYRHRLRL
jgi:hypothetical protein